HSVGWCGGAGGARRRGGRAPGGRPGPPPPSSPSANVKMTDVGTPRDETLIVDILNGYAADPMQMNPYLPGSVSMDSGLHQLIFAYLWEIDTVKGEQFPEVASEMPQPMDNTNTKFRFRIRQGVKWTDGVDLTADDVQYTSDMILNTPELAYNGYYRTLVKSMKAIDRYTIEMETMQPEAKIAQKLGVVIWGQTFKVMPKHIWEKENPRTFKNSNPIGAHAYILKARDTTSGNWFLYEKRPDWQNSLTAQIAGEPKPKYILFKYFGTEERRVMAAINNELDILQDITPESMDILLQRSNTIQAWYAGFPYADMNDPCARGIQYNVSKAPYDNVDVRWALTLATDAKAVAMSSFGGMLRSTPLQLPPIDVLQETYHKPMVSWLKNFALSDGYKPFDENYAHDIVAMLRAEGKQGLPATPQEEINVFGIGWWKYDVNEAARLLEKNGFRQVNGRWMLPNGQPWQISINAPANFEVQSMRLAFAVADSWRKFGIEAEVRQLDTANFDQAASNGSFEVGAYWPTCGLLPDITTNIVQWHSQYIVPNGQLAPGNTSRWRNDTASRLLDELAPLPSDDPEVVQKVTQFLQEYVREIPNVAMYGTSKFVPVNTYYWNGFQTAENAFEGPWWWWSQFKYYLPHYQPTGNK
ncbi:MAG: ABC transporter substrate-binding protein, partial [Treponema sp.]|nr:ABC transporter substrate-binding protein [Treponema sp.]